MNKNRTCVFIAAAILALCLYSPAVFAGNDILSESIYNNVVSSVIRLDVSGGVILGEKADYFLIIPKEIRDLLVVDRAVLKDSSFAIEKLDFYCASYSQKYKPAFLMSLYVFEKIQWNESYDLQTVKKSKDYVFAAEFTDNDGFTQAQDKAFYSYCKSYLGEVESINNLISLPKYQDNPYSNTAFVNGTPLKDKIEIIDEVYYVPLRAVFEQMDYLVGWNSRRNTVDISKDSFRDSFIIKNGKYSGKGFKITVINDRTYISTSYFLKVLRKNIEIDESNNVYMLSNS